MAGGILGGLFGGGDDAPIPGLLDAAGYMDPQQYDRMRRSDAMQGLWAGLLQGSGPSLEPRNFFSALGGGLAGSQKFGNEFDESQLRAAQAAQARAAVPKSIAETGIFGDIARLNKAALSGEFSMYGPPGGSGTTASPGAPAASGGGPGGGPGGGGNLSDPRGLVPYIRAEAARLNIDPDIAVRVAGSEGLGTFLGDGGKSGGAFQLYTGGGVGNLFQNDTGLDPLDPANEKATITYALQHAAKNGWGDWNGAKKLGITGYTGIGKPGEPSAANVTDLSAVPDFTGAMMGRQGASYAPATPPPMPGAVAAGAPGPAPAPGATVIPDNALPAGSLPVPGHEYVSLPNGKIGIRAKEPPAGERPPTTVPAVTSVPGPTNGIDPRRGVQLEQLGPRLAPEAQAALAALAGPAAQQGLAQFAGPGAAGPVASAPLPPPLPAATVAPAPALPPGATGELVPGGRAQLAPSPGILAAPPAAMAPPAPAPAAPAVVREPSIVPPAAAAAPGPGPRQVSPGLAGPPGLPAVNPRWQALNEALARSYSALGKPVPPGVAEAAKLPITEREKAIDRYNQLLQQGVYFDPATGSMKAVPGAGEALSAKERATPTPDIKNYDAYYNQETRAGRSPLSMFDWSRAEKSASATNVIQKVEGQGQAALVKASIDEMQVATAAAQAANRSDQQYGQMAQAMQGFRPGATAEMRTNAMAILKDLGIAAGPEVAPAEIFRMAARQLALHAAPKGQGQVSNFERGLYAEAVPQMVNSPETLTQAIEIGRRLNEYDRRVAQIHLQVAHDNGNLPNMVEAARQIQTLGPPLSPAEMNALQMNRDRAQAAPGAQPAAGAPTRMRWDPAANNGRGGPVPER